MYTRKVTIINPTGLHARPASDFVRLASDYPCNITVVRTDSPQQEANAKSILMILSLALTKGTEIIISADGDGEREAADALAEMIVSGCGEL